MRITTLADIAGRVAQEQRNADRITAAAICLPSGGLRNIRKLVPSNLPKWRDAVDADVKLVIDLVLREALGIGVYSTEKSNDRWDKFWSDARSLNAETFGKISFIKAAYQIKCLMFTKSTALASATAFKTGNVVRASTRQRGLSTRESLILDSEIEGGENVDVFKNIWRRMNLGQPLKETIGITRTFEEIHLVTEQQDRLLMLPDYIAGIVHAAGSQANVLAASRVSAECVQRMLCRLEQTPRYQLVCEPFPLVLSEILGK